MNIASMVSRYNRSQKRKSVISSDDSLISASDLSKEWGLSYIATCEEIKRLRIPLAFNIANEKFYDRETCNKKMPFLSECKIIKPEKKEVESMDKNEELQKWLNDDRYVQVKELEIMWNVGKTGARAFLHRRKIRPVKVFCHSQGSSAFYDKQQCINARLIHDAKIQELPKWLNDDRYVHRKELEIMWGIGKKTASNFISDRNIKPIKKINAGGANNFAFYDRAECEAARPFINQPEKEVEKVNMEKELAIKTITQKQLGQIWGLSSSQVSRLLQENGIQPISESCRVNEPALYDRAECESIYLIDEPQKQMELPEPKEQTPDIIPADTIDLFTMSELESELKQRGVELTAEVKAKINASDMPEMQEIATMIRGNAKTIAIRLSVLNEIARQLQDVESENDDENEEQDVFYSYHQASELLGISMGSLRNKVNAIGMTLKKNGVKAYFTANQIDSLRKQPKESDESPSARDIDDKFNTILSRLKEIEYQVVYSENFGPSEDIINHFKSAIQSRSNVLAALTSRAKIVIHNESCVILLDQKFAVDKVSESKSKETINNALMDIGCKDFNIYVLFSGKHDVKNNQEK